MRVRFLETVIYETEGLGKGPKYEAGSVHDFREDIARRWLNRGKAELAEEESPAPSKSRPKLSLAAKGV